MNVGRVRQEKDKRSAGNAGGTEARPGEGAGGTTQTEGSQGKLSGWESKGTNRCRTISHIFITELANRKTQSLKKTYVSLLPAIAP